MSTSAQVATDAQAAKDTILDKGWCQFNLMKPKTGEVCLIGAARMAIFGTTNLTWDMYQEDKANGHPLDTRGRAFQAAISSVVGVSSIPGWNDTDGRTVDEVLAALDKVIAIHTEVDVPEDAASLSEETVNA